MPAQALAGILPLLPVLTWLGMLVFWYTASHLGRWQPWPERIHLPRRTHAVLVRRGILGRRVVSRHLWARLRRDFDDAVLASMVVYAVIVAHLVGLF